MSQITRLSTFDYRLSTTNYSSPAGCRTICGLCKGCGFSSMAPRRCLLHCAKSATTLEHPLPFPSKTAKIPAHATRTKLSSMRTPHVALSLLALELPHRAPPLRRLRIRRHSSAHPLHPDQRLPRMPLRRHAPRRRKPQLRLALCPECSDRFFLGGRSFSSDINGAK